MDRHQTTAHLQRVAQLLQRGVGDLLVQFIQPLQLSTVQRGVPMPACQGGRLARLAIAPQPALKGGDIDAIAARHLHLGLPGRMGRKGTLPYLL